MLQPRLKPFLTPDFLTLQKEGPGYGGSHGMFASPFAPKVAPEGELWSFTITGTVRTGVVMDADNKMYVAATAQSEDAFPYIYRVDMSRGAPEYEWLESLDTTGSAIFGNPIIGHEKGRRVLYLAATTDGTATNSDNTYIYAFATDPLANATRISKRTDLLWTFPSSVSASYSNVGEIKGSGALHHSGVLMFGTRARGDANYGGSNGVIAVKEGTQLWRFDSGEAPVSTSLIVDGPESTSDHDGYCCDSVYFVAAAGSSNEARLYAVDVYNGKKKWDFVLKADTETEGPEVVGAPSFGAHQDILLGFGNRLHSIDKKGGVENWSHEVEGAGKDSEFIAAAAVHDGVYFIGNDQGKFFRFKPLEDNTGVDQLAIPVSMGKIESSPLIYGHAEVMQVDSYGKAEAWKLNGKYPVWTYNYDTTIADGRQPAITSDGKILLGISNAIVAIGGSGGCLAGYSTRNAIVRGWNDANKSWGSYNGSVPMLLSKDGFCEKCGIGNFSKSVGSPSCERCEAGKWSGKKGATFCYECQQPSWCLGGNQCLEGNEGTMCNFCVEGYYLMFTGCIECPKNPFLYTLAAIGGLILFMFIYMHFTRGTKFAYEVNKDDVVAIYINNGTRCENCNATLTCGLSGSQSVRVERKVTRVIDDYSIEVSRNFGNKHKIKNVPFWLIKCRVYGDEVRKQGSGRVTIGTAADMLDDESKAKLDTLAGLSNSTRNETGNLSSLMNRDPKDEIDYGVGDNRTIVHGKSQSVGTEVLMCASLLMVGYAQSTSVFIQIPIGWPYFAVRIFGMLGQIIQFDISSLAISPDCDWRWSYTQKWYGAMVFPLFVGLYLVLQYYLYSACIAHILIRKQHQNKVINTACIMMVLLYVFVTAKTIEPYACTEWEDQSRTMNADPDIQCTWIRGDAFTKYARMAMLGMFFFIFYGVGIPVALFSMLYKAKMNHTMGSVMTKEKFGWIYIRFTYEYYFWEIAIMCRKFLFVLVILLAGTEREMLSWCIAVVCFAIFVQYYYRPFNCFDCLLGRSRRCTHWGAMDQLELGLLLAQLAMLCIGYYLLEQGQDPAENAGDIGIAEMIMLGKSVCNHGVTFSKS